MLAHRLVIWNVASASVEKENDISNGQDILRQFTCKHIPHARNQNKTLVTPIGCFDEPRTSRSPFVGEQGLFSSPHVMPI